MSDGFRHHERHPVTGACVWCGANSTSSVGCTRGPDEVERLKPQLAQALARAERAELENRAWRALAELQDGRYDVAFPGRRTMGDFGGSVGDRTKREKDEFGLSHVSRVYGEGATAGEAAIRLATKLGLLPPQPQPPQESDQGKEGED